MEKGKTSDAKLIVGLGNPGKEYLKTRHNIGFLFLDMLVNNLQQKENLSALFEFQKKFKSEVAVIRKEEVKIIFTKPNTFMNKSGEAVKELMSFYKIKPKNLLLIHDDLDLPFGTIRISKDRGPAGHNGVESVIKELGTKNFSRIRSGIFSENKKQTSGEKFVLDNFSKEEMALINSTLCKKMEKMLWNFVEEGFFATANKYNSAEASLNEKA